MSRYAAIMCLSSSVFCQLPRSLQSRTKPVLRLGFREKEELKKLESAVDDLTLRKDEAEDQIAEAAQGGDFQKVAALTADLESLSQKLEIATDRWLELAERAEIAGTV
jgi:ABC transport system ATP-binding/permease protein